MKESDWELRTRRLREKAYAMSDKERLSMGISHAGQRIFMDTLEALDKGTRVFTRRLPGGSE